MDLEKRHFLLKRMGVAVAFYNPRAAGPAWARGGRELGRSSVRAPPWGSPRCPALCGPDRGRETQRAPSIPGSLMRPRPSEAVHLWSATLHASYGTSTGAHGGHRGFAQPDGPEQAWHRLPAARRPRRTT